MNRQHHESHEWQHESVKPRWWPLEHLVPQAGSKRQHWSYDGKRHHNAYGAFSEENRANDKRSDEGEDYVTDIITPFEFEVFPEIGGHESHCERDQDEDGCNVRNAPGAPNDPPGRFTPALP